MPKTDAIEDLFDEILEADNTLRKALAEMPKWVEQMQQTGRADQARAIKGVLLAFQRLRRVEAHKSELMKQFAKRDFTAADRPQLRATMTKNLAAMRSVEKEIEKARPKFER